jgi:hypothetical protein
VTKQSKQKTMKDFILGTDEYIIRLQDYLTDLLAPYCDPLQPPPPPHILTILLRRVHRMVVWGGGEMGPWMKM